MKNAGYCNRRLVKIFGKGIEQGADRIHSLHLMSLALCKDLSLSLSETMVWTIKGRVFCSVADNGLYVPY